MSISTTLVPAKPARIINAGNAPTAQSGAGGQWVNAWSVSGISALQKGDVSNDGEAWTAVKYTDLLASTLAGGDLYRGDLGVSGQSAATSSVKQEIDGKQALRFQLTEAAQSVTLNLSSFFANDDGSDFAEAVRIRLFDASGAQVSESFVHAYSTSGNQLIALSSAQVFHTVEISAGAQRADGSFAYGGYSNSDGSFGSDSYVSGGTHGSDFLVHAISVTLARPATKADSYTLDEDALPATFTSVLANDQDPNHAELNAVLVETTGHGTLTLNPDGSFIYQPDADYFGNDSFSYRASNAKDASNITVVTLTVRPVNDAPTAVNDAAATNEDSSVDGNVLSGASGGRDSDKDGDTLTVSSVGTLVSTLGATVTMNANGDFHYDPTGAATLQALASGVSVTDGFDYTVSDGHGGSNTAHVSVTVDGRDEAVGRGLIASVNPGTELSYYMRYDNGSKGKIEWIKIDSVSLGAVAETSVSKGSGTTVGKPTPDAITLELGSSKAVADMLTNLVKGTAFQSVEIEAYAGSGKTAQVVQELKLTGAYVSGVQTRSAADGATLNTVSLVYKTIDETLSPLDSHGQASLVQDVRWNVEAKNTDLAVSAVVTPGANANLAPPMAQTPSSAALQYYAHVDGVDGWVALDSFSMGFSADTSDLIGTGTAVGKATASSVTLGLGLNSVLGTLFKNIIVGTHANSVQIEAYAPGTGPGSAATLVDEYIFTNAYTTAITSNSDAVNTASLVYSAFTHGHVDYDVAGKASNSGFGFDIANYKALSAPIAHADALTAPLAIASVTPGTELSYYMRYKNTSGDSQWVKIDSVSLGAVAKTSFLKGSNVDVGTPTPDGITLELGSSKAVADMLTNMIKGAAFQSVEIEAYAGSGKTAQVVQELKLTGAYVFGVQTSSAANGATLNTVSLAYKTIDETLSPLDSHGQATLVQDVRWNVPVTNTDLAVSAVVTPGANADLAHLMAQTPSSAALQYYAHVDGVDGWVALDSFSMGFSADNSQLIGTGATVGRAAPSSVTLGMGLNSVLGTLFKNVIAGTHANSVQIEAYAPGASPGSAATLVDEYIFTNAFTTAITSNSDAVNTASLVYSAFTHGHVDYDVAGKASNSGVGLDIANYKVLSAPIAHADALTAPLAIASVTPGTELSYYLRYKNTSGDSQWVKIDSVSLGAEAGTSFPKGNNAPVGKPTPDAITLELGSSKAVADMLTNMIKGAAFQSVEIEAYAGSGKTAQVVQELKLTGAYVSGVQTSSAADGTTLNTVSLAYKTIDETLSPLDSHGQATLVQDVRWNVEAMNTNLAVSAVVTPGANADLAHLMAQTPSSAALQYYAHVDGVDGWVALDSFSMGFSADNSHLIGTGAAVGKAAASSVTLGLGLNNVLGTLFKNVIAGTHANSVQIEAYAPHGGTNNGPSLVDEYFFKAVFTNDVAQDSDAANTVAFVYQSFTHSHLNAGQSNPNDFIGIGVDMSSLQVIGMPTPHPDVFP